MIDSVKYYFRRLLTEKNDFGNWGGALFSTFFAMPCIIGVFYHAVTGNFGFVENYIGDPPSFINAVHLNAALGPTGTLVARILSTRP